MEREWFSRTIYFIFLYRETVDSRVKKLSLEFDTKDFYLFLFSNASREL